MHDVTKSCMSERYTQSARLMNGFNVTESEKFSDMVSDSTLQLRFQKLSIPFVEFWCNIKVEFSVIRKGY